MLSPEIKAGQAAAGPAFILPVIYSERELTISLP
jgi:hypothetical protein